VFEDSQTLCDVLSKVPRLYFILVRTNIPQKLRDPGLPQKLDPRELSRKATRSLDACENSVG